MKKGNKGEWSELYVLLRLLADGKLYIVDEKLIKDDDCYKPVLDIFRDEIKSRHVEYKRSSQKYVELYLNGAFVRKIETVELVDMAQKFFGAIVQNDDDFFADDARKIMRKLECTKIKADSNDKADIRLKVYDSDIKRPMIYGYSIKSYVGGSPTLLNASRATNFIFSIEGMTDEAMAAVNAIDTRNKIRDRLSRLGALNFVSVANENFHGSLNLVGETVEKILAEMLKIYYLERVSGCAELVTLLEERDPFDFDYPDYYRYKIKKFLCAVALGLNPSKQWNGLDEANGGYIIVKEDGDVIAYHLYDRNNFETYLLNHTRFETASTTKHDFASVYSREGKYYINLNLQIRFK